MINVGIIGYGKMGQIRYKDIKLDNVRIVSVYEPSDIDISSEVARAVDSDKIINDPEVDIIFICTPNYLNKLFTISSLNW